MREQATGNREQGTGTALPRALVGRRTDASVWEICLVLRQRVPIRVAENDLSVSLTADSSPGRGAKRGTVRQPWLPFQGSCHAKRD